MKNLDNKIQVLNENRGEVSLYEYVIAESQSDPNFFRFLFDADLEKDFDSSLTDEQKEEFENWTIELRKEFLLEKWIVVSFPYADPDDSIRVTRRENFAKMNFCDAYGDYGKQVGCDAAGCYTFSNSESSIFLDFTKELYQKFQIESIVDENEMTDREFCEFFIDSMNYKPGRELFGAGVFDEILSYFKAWKEQNETHTEVTGWTYHDSRNFETVVSECDFGEPDCTELDEEEQIEILIQMPETAPHIEGTNTIEETEDFLFHFDRWATNPWFCYVERK